MKGFKISTTIIASLLIMSCSKAKLDTQLKESEIVETSETSFQSTGMDLIQVSNSDYESGTFSGKVWLKNNDKPLFFNRTKSATGEVTISISDGTSTLSSVSIDVANKEFELSSKNGSTKTAFNTSLKRKGGSRLGSGNDLLPFFIEYELADLSANGSKRAVVKDLAQKRSRHFVKAIASNCETTFVNVAATLDEVVYDTGVEMSSFMTAYGCEGSITCGNSALFFYGFVAIRICNAHLNCETCPW